jgi:hypothetical protein
LAGKSPDRGGKLPRRGIGHSAGGLSLVKENGVAGLPPDGEWVVQQNDGVVSIFNQYTQEEIVAFNTSEGVGVAARAQRIISDTERLTDEQKCFAHFWSGYFYAYSSPYRGYEHFYNKGDG